MKLKNILLHLTRGLSFNFLHMVIFRTLLRRWQDVVKFDFENENVVLKLPNVVNTNFEIDSID